jgi:methylated-DNA-[protein]-cysteine S-methyltransferase
MVIVGSDKGLCCVEFQKPGRMALIEKRFDKWYPNHFFIDEENEFTRLASIWLDKYFKKELVGLDIPALDVRGTGFEIRTWEELKKIPFGQTVTYGELAGRLGKPGAARAIGNCMRRNPVSIIVPCHRVIGSSGSLTGYGGGLDKKRLLLNHEGIL